MNAASTVIDSMLASACTGSRLLYMEVPAAAPESATIDVVSARQPVCFSHTGAQHGSHLLPCRCRPPSGLIDAGLNPETPPLRRRRRTRSSSRTGSHQAVRDRPLERSHIELRAGGTHETNRAHLLRRLH